MALPELPENRFSRVVDGALAALGRASSWIWLILMGIVVFNVALRYVFGEGRVELEELQWHLNAVGFLLAVVYAFQSDKHIRIDLVSSRLGARRQAWIELYGITLLLLPFIVLVIWYSLPFVVHSWEAAEVSQSPGGLPYRWLLKAVLPCAFVLLLVGTISRLTRVWAYLSRTES